MYKPKVASRLLAGAAFVLVATPALAQKSADTVRIAVEQPVNVVDLIFDPQPQVTLIAYNVHDSLLYYDAEKREFGGLLAKSWKRIDDKTMEFQLKEGVKFHNGQEFTADDVVHMVEMVTNPKVKFRFKENRYGWIAGVEKMGKHTVRVRSKELYAPFENSMARSLPIHPHGVYKDLGNPAEFGRNPVGTGSHRVTKVDDNAGVTMTLQDSYKHGGDLKPAGGVKTIQFLPIPDKQSQVAQMLTGGIEIMYEVQNDQANALRDNPNLEVLVYPTVQFSYLYPDTANRSGVGVFKDERVRRAVFHAVNREAMKKAMLPKEGWDQPLPSGMCHEWHIGCAHDAKPVDYDPAKAKKLLAEAGYPNGFDLQITSWGAVLPQTEAVAGYLREVGIRATVDAVTFGVYNRKRNAGEVQMFGSFWDNGGGNPDVNGTAGFFFLSGVRNFHHDPQLEASVEAGQQELDPKKREAIYRAAFNRATEQQYFFPLIPMPATVVHHKDVVLHAGHMSPKGFLPNRMSWAK